MIELTIVVMLVAALAAISIPMFGRIDTAREDRAALDCGVVADALVRYMQDTRLRPTGRLGAADIDLLVSERGARPRLPRLRRTARPLSRVLRTNTWSNPRWRGPYVEPVPPDPWGHQYVVWAANFHSPRPVWVLSAGPDGILQTGATHGSPQGDDIGVAVE